MQVRKLIVIIIIIIILINQTYISYKEFRAIKNRIQKTDSSHLTHSRNSSLDSSSISTSEFFHFPSDKSPFDHDLNTTFNEDILDTEVIFIVNYLFFFSISPHILN